MAWAPHRKSWQTFQALLEADDFLFAPLDDLADTYSINDIERHQWTREWPELFDGLFSDAVQHEPAHNQAIDQQAPDPLLCDLDNAGTFEDQSVRSPKNDIDKQNIRSARHTPCHEDTCKPSRIDQEDIERVRPRTSPVNAVSSSYSFETSLLQPSISSSMTTKRKHHCLASGCDKSFDYPKDVRRHMLTHQPDNQFYCPYVECDRAVEGFGRKDSLQRHLRNKHGDRLIEET